MSVSDTRWHSVHVGFGGIADALTTRAWLALEELVVFEVDKVSQPGSSNRYQREAVDTLREGSAYLTLFTSA